MSLKKSTTRHLALFASSALLTASLTAFAFTGAVLAPTAAFAANECDPVGVDPSANGATADVYACTGATTYQATGITYSSAGNLTVNTTGAMDVGAVGVNLTGNGSDTVAFTANNVLTGSSGPVIDLASGSGAITATLGGLTTGPASTHGIRAQSTGGGNITLTKTNTNALNNNAGGAEALVTAITNGGNITMSVNVGGSVNPPATGRLRGILAQTSGAGGVTMTLAGMGGYASSAEDGIAAVDIVAGTGGVNLTLSTGKLLGGDNLALRIASGSAVNVNNTNGQVAGAVDFSGVTSGGVNFQNSGAGGTFGEGGRWLASGASTFSAQADTVGLTGGRAHTLAKDASIDFGGGADTLNHSAFLVTSGATITGLEAFNNSGVIYFGGVPSTGLLSATDRVADDFLSAPGATFTGSGSSRIILDVVMGGDSQVGCETIVTADCLDLSGGATAGSTVLTVNDVSPDSLQSGYIPDGITLIDVAGGTTSAAHFTLDPASTDGYVHPVYGPGFDRPGHYVYLFRYDDENQRFVLISQPKSRDLFDYAILSGAAQSVWNLTARTVASRQTDLRDGAEGGAVWLRTAGEVTRRNQSTSFEGWDDTYVFDNSYKLYTGTIMGGADLISGSRGEFDYVFGAQLGYVSSSFDMNESESSGRFTGATGGAYASLWSDGFFLDGALNLNGLALDYQHPALGSKTTTYVNSIGAIAEAGVRARLTENTFAEPLATVSWVRTSFEEISLSGAKVQPADAESLRGSLGLRLGATLAGDSVSASYFVTGRAWNEFEGESGGVVRNAGADLPFADTFDGAFGEAELGVNIFNAANTLSGFATTGVKWKKGYSTVDLALGVRMAW